MLLRSGCGFWRLFQPHSCGCSTSPCNVLSALCLLLACRRASLICLPGRYWLKRQLAIIHEAQRARGVPLDEGWYQRLRAMPALIIPLTHNALNDLAVRGAALDMRAFRINNRRTTLWAPADSTLQRVARYTMILLMLAEFGAWIWLR